MSQTIEQLANEVRHLTAKIPRLNEACPSNLPPKTRGLLRRKRIPADQLLIIGKMRISKKALSRVRLGELERSVECLRNRLEKLESNLAQWRIDLEKTR